MLVSFWDDVDALNANTRYSGDEQHALTRADVSSSGGEMTKLRCANDQDCPYGRVVENDEGISRSFPEEAYSQSGDPAYLGLCLNCLDDHRREMEDAD